MYIKRAYNCVFDKKGEQGLIRFRVKWNHNKSIVSFSMGFTVELAKWNSDTQRCKNNTSHGKNVIPAYIINKEIQRYEDVANDVFSHFESKERLPSEQEFKDMFLIKTGKSDRKEVKDFFDIYDEFMLKTGSFNSWTETTRVKYTSLKSHLFNFDPKLSFNALTEDKLIEFVKYQQSPRAMELHTGRFSGMKNTTISKNIGFLKTFLRWAKKNKHYELNAHDGFSPKLKGTDLKDVIHLTWKELIHLLDFKFDNQGLERAKDVFCFCCFTGLRYSDVAKLRKEDVKDNHIDVVTQKTTDSLKIELNKYSRSILEKYKDIDGCFALPVISNAKMNKYLKEIGEIAEINEPQRVVYFIGSERKEEVFSKYELLTTHCGRRTFIVNSLYLGIPAEVIMKWTGHKDYKAMKPYVKIVDELKSSEMSKFDTFSP